MELSIIFFFLLSGIIISYFNLISREILLKSKYVTNIGLLFLLFSMGIKIGASEEIIKNLNIIGLKALLIAVFTIMGSICLLWIFSSKNVFKNILIKSENKIKVKDDSDKIRLDYLIILPTITGAITGYLFIPVNYLSVIDTFTSYALYLLLFGVGMELGLNKELFEQVKNYSLKIFLIPVLIAGGSILGAVIAGLILGLSTNLSAAIGSGFGWYSLSGIIITNLGFPEIGSLAFLSNVFRELMTIISLPFIVKYFGKLTGIAPGGATTMDVTLPVIKETAGEETVIPAFFSGAVLSILVPILVPFLIKL